MRLSDFARLSPLAEGKVAVQSTSVRAVSVLHRVKRQSARDIVVESDLELIAAGKATLRLAGSRVRGSRH